MFAFRIKVGDLLVVLAALFGRPDQRHDRDPDMLRQADPGCRQFCQLKVLNRGCAGSRAAINKGGVLLRNGQRFDSHRLHSLCPIGMPPDVAARRSPCVAPRGRHVLLDGRASPGHARPPPGRRLVGLARCPPDDAGDEKLANLGVGRPAVAGRRTKSGRVRSFPVHEDLRPVLDGLPTGRRPAARAAGG